MDNFDLKKYLAEGKLLKEEMSLDVFLKNQLAGIEGKTEGTETVEKEEWLDMFGGTKNESGFDDIYNLIKKGKDSHSIDFGDFKANYDLKIGDDKIIIKYKTKGKLNEQLDLSNRDYSAKKLFALIARDLKFSSRVQDNEMLDADEALEIMRKVIEIEGSEISPEAALGEYILGGEL